MTSKCVIVALLVLAVVACSYALEACPALPEVALPCPVKRNLCQTNANCNDGKICCESGCGKKCTSSAPKRGTCPTNRPGDAGVCARFCQNDGACRGSLKCCNTACGGATCMPPVGTTQG
ncbi:hypothetical protein B566_EDAN000741 [Ephemera danica]|nr:hypothetical protein B566_EDAN000741 [Ephemera danica]